MRAPPVQLELPAMPERPSLSDRGIRFTCEDCRQVEWPVGDLVIADPPWKYSQKFGEGTAEDHYPGWNTKDVAAFLAALQAPRLALWITFPILAEWMAATQRWAWGPARTGGAWSKSLEGDKGHYGPGYHWGGCAEMVLIYTRKGAFNNRQKLRNSWVEAPSVHSRKPVGWMQQWMNRWTPPGGLVLDPFAGTGSVVEAAIAEGRRCVATEINPETYAAALAGTGLRA